MGISINILPETSQQNEYVITRCFIKKKRKEDFFEHMIFRQAPFVCIYFSRTSQGLARFARFFRHSPADVQRNFAQFDLLEHRDRVPMT